MKSTHRTRVLFIIPSLGAGGAERVLLNFLGVADRTSFEICLLVICDRGALRDQIPHGIKVYSLFRSPIFERIARYLYRAYDWGVPYRLMLRVKLRGKYDIGVSYQDSKYTDLLFHIKGLKKRICWVHSSMDTNPNYLRTLNKESYRKRLISSRYEKIDKIVFVSESAKKSFFRLYDFSLRSKTDVVNNILNLNSIRLKAEEDTNISQGSFLFVAIGNLLPVKGFARLVRSSKLLKDKGYAFRVYIIGSGPERKKLNELAIAHGVCDSVVFSGFVKNPYPILKSADVFVMTSISEAMPTVLCEAFALGKPVIATRCDAVEEFTNNGKYAVIAEQDDRNLAESMELLMTNPSILEKYARLSYERATFFDDERAVEKYHSILRMS